LIFNQFRLGRSCRNSPPLSTPRLGEDDRALGDERLAEQDAVDAGDQLHERLPSRLDRAQAQILAI
jgi:hypothetical protein